MVEEAYERGFVDKILGDIFYTTTQKIREELTNTIPVDKNTYILVVACRGGETVFYFAKEIGCTVVGSDIFEAHIKEAEKIARREKLTKKVSFVRGFAEDLPFEDGTFDLVVLERSLSCYDNKAKAISECSRVLKEGGTFAMADFTTTEMSDEDQEELKELTCLVTSLSVETFKDYMEQAGLSNIVTEEKEQIAEKNMKLLLQKWKKIRLFSNIFLKASSADAGRFENLMRRGEKAIREQKLGYMLYMGKKA
ncbi:class I SAM-dependent methyltransferase [archaeon]|nr:MAG: class I SAM-dependent methyltransferase [archaeon]